MIEYQAEPDGEFITIRMIGTLSETDYDAVAAPLGELAWHELGVGHSRSSSHPLRLMLDWRSLEGWQKGAKTLGTLFGLRNRDLIDRIAVVSTKWKDERDRIADIYKHAEVRMYSDDAYNVAAQWLRGG